MEMEMTGAAKLLRQENAYSGKFYHLSPPREKKISFDWVKEKLEGQKIDVESEVDLREQDGLHIPEIFRTGESVNRASFGDIYSFQDKVSGILGVVQHNDPETIVYDEQEVLILRSQETRFVIFERNEQYYLSMLGRRSLVTSVLDLIFEELRELGFTVDEASIHHTEFEDIAEDLVDNLRTTTIRGYPSPSIDAKDIRGFGFENEHEYERELREGIIHGQQFETTQVENGESKTVQISGDGLVGTV